MITKNNRPADSIWQRLKALFKQRVSSRDNSEVLAESAFDLIIAKEISRCLRRPGKHQFAIVQTNLGADQLNEPLVVQFISQVKNRFRITDEPGNWHAQVSLLLPETGREGARHVANEMLAIAKSLSLNLSTQILVYPEDDAISGNSKIKEQSDRGSDVGQENEKVSTNGTTTFSGYLGDTHLDHAGAEVANKTSVLEDPPYPVASEGRLAVRKSGEFRITPLIPTPIWKRAIDVLGSGVGMIGFVPIYVLVGAAIKLDSRGPVMFTQVREGKGGRPFKIYKFRTMRFDAEAMKTQLRGISEQDGPAFKIENDPRVTRMGYFLRKSCLDELPQLINVLKGDMSLVGPRPLPVDESQSCEMWHRQRLAVAPGLTCIWQVFGGRQVSFEEWMRMDLDYIQRRSLWLDFKLLVCTFFKVVQQRGSV